MEKAADVETPAGSVTALPVIWNIGNTMTLASTSWVKWVNKHLVIIWMEITFLLYWAMAINVAYGGLITYWNYYLAPLRKQNAKMAETEIAQFACTVGAFCVFYLCSVYLLFLLAVGLKKKNDRNLYAWTVLNLVTIPVLIMIFLYVLIQEGVMSGFNLSLLSIIMARIIVIMLVAEVAWEFRVNNMCKNMVQERIRAMELALEEQRERETEEEDHEDEVEPKGHHGHHLVKVMFHGLGPIEEEDACPEYPETGTEEVKHEEVEEEKIQHKMITLHARVHGI